MTQTDLPLFSFGVIADPQYADIDPRLEYNRYYRESLDKLDAAIDAFNQRELSFVITLGDVIDRHFESFDAIMPHYDALKHEALFIPGNHDFAVADEKLPLVFDRLKMPAPYYSVVRRAIRFIMLDGNEISLFSTPEGHPQHEEAKQLLQQLSQQGEMNAQTWNGGLGTEQFTWLRNELHQAQQNGEKVIIFCHYPIYPPNRHNLLGHHEVCNLISNQPHVLAWMNGHNHDGNYARYHHTHCITHSHLRQRNQRKLN